MKWFNNLKVGKKVFISCSFFLICIIAISFNSYINLKRADGSFKAFYENKFRGSIYLNKIYSSFLQLKINMLLQSIAAGNNNDKELGKLIDESKSIIQLYSTNIDSFSSLTLSEEEKNLLGNLQDEVKKGAEQRIRFSESIAKGDIDQGRKFMENWFIKHTVGADIIDSIVDLQIAEGKNIIELQGKSSYSTIILISALALLSLALGIVIIFVLTKSVSGPVNMGLSFARKLEQGDFTGRIELNQNDELGILCRALNKTADNLEILISEAVLASQNLAEGVKQIATGNQNLSQRTSEQASALEEVASTIEEASTSINLNFENSQNAKNMSESSSRTALQGGEHVNDTISSINEVNSSAKKIDEITSVINEIAFQTNLLALNAAVEAARAGDQGRGFAVVAGEVRNLAQRAGNAAKEIAHLINDTVMKVEDGTKKTYKSGESLKEIITSVQNVAALIDEIAASSKEQKQGMEQISTAISELDNMTQHNAALVEETAGASEEMTNQAQALITLTSKFKIRGKNGIRGNTDTADALSSLKTATARKTTVMNDSSPISGDESYEMF